MKVALLTRDYPPMIGGIATHASNLARELQRLGVEVDVVLGGSDLKTLLAPLSRSFDQYDIVHAQSSPYGAFVRGAPLVVTVHGSVKDEWSYYPWSSKAKSVPAVLMEKAAFRRAKAILAVSETTSTNLVERYGIQESKVTVIGNGVDCSFFSTAGVGSKKDGSVLLVSRLEPRKNVAEGLRALSLLPSEGYQAKIAGDGSQRSELERLARSLGVRAEFLGRVPEDSLIELYREASVFLTTSFSEGFGLSLLEGMAAGCAVVASDIPTHRDLIEDGSNGILYTNQSDLARELGSLLSDPGGARRLGTAAAETAKKFSWDVVARRVLAVYKDCVS